MDLDFCLGDFDLDFRLGDFDLDFRFGDLDLDFCLGDFDLDFILCLLLGDLDLRLGDLDLDRFLGGDLDFNCFLGDFDLDFLLAGDLDLNSSLCRGEKDLFLRLGDFDFSFLGDFDLDLFLLGDFERFLSVDLLLEDLCGDFDLERWRFLGEGDPSLCLDLDLECRCLRLPLLSGLLDLERCLLFPLSLDRDLLLLCSCPSFPFSSSGRSVSYSSSFFSSISFISCSSLRLKTSSPFSSSFAETWPF